MERTLGSAGAKGYKVDRDSRRPGRWPRFNGSWPIVSKRMKPVYMACSLPDTFTYPEESPRSRLLSEAVLPSCRELNIPLSLMIGPRYQVNPAIRLAGDAAGKADLRALERLCVHSPTIASW